MPFRKVDVQKEIEKAIKKNPELEELMKQGEKEYEDIKSGKLKKKFGQ